MKFLIKKANSKIVFYFTIFLLLYFVFLDEVTETFLLNTTAKLLLNDSWLHEHTMACLLLSLQIIFSPLQAGFSDYYLRKKSIVVSITATILSVFILKVLSSKSAIFFIIAFVLKGALGNTLPIAWAGISDETKGKKVRFFLALSICALAVGSWGTLMVAPYLKFSLFYKWVAGILVSGMLFALFFYWDPEDNPHATDPLHPSRDEKKKKELKQLTVFNLLKKECLGIYHLGKKKLNLLVLGAFLFSEISFYQILFRVEVFDDYQYFTTVPLAIGIGYTLGTIVLKFIQAEDKSVSLFGLIISFFSIIAINFLFVFIHLSQTVFIALFALYSFGYALFTPAIFSLVAVREPLHDQGKVYGLLESTDSLASLITFILIFMTKNISHTSSLSISTFLILICGIIFLFAFRVEGRMPS